MKNLLPLFGAVAILGIGCVDRGTGEQTVALSVEGQPSLQQFLMREVLANRGKARWAGGLQIRSEANCLPALSDDEGLVYRLDGFRLVLPGTAFRVGASWTPSVWTRRLYRNAGCAYRREDGTTSVLGAGLAGGIGDVKDCLRFLVEDLEARMADANSQEALLGVERGLAKRPDEDLFVTVMTLDANEVVANADAEPVGLLSALAAMEFQLVFTENGWVRSDCNEVTVYSTQWNGQGMHSAVVFDRHGRLLATVIGNSRQTDLKDVLRTAASLRCAWDQWDKAGPGVRERGPSARLPQKTALGP